MSGALSWVNKVRDDADGAVSVGSAQGSFTSNAIDSAYPGRNAISPDPSLVTQVDYQTSSSAPYESYVEANWTSNAPARVVAALNVRLASTVVGVRFALLNQAGTTLETTTQIPLASLIPIPGETDRYDIFAILSATRSVNRLRFQVQVPASSTDYYEVGTLWAGDGLVFPRGVGAEWGYTVEDQSIVEDQPSGGFAAYPYQTQDVVEIRKRGLTQAEGMGEAGSVNSIRHMLRVAGRHTPIIVISSDETTDKAQTMSVYGRIVDSQGVATLSRDLYGMAMRVRQIR